jgi:hypothetical protein
MHATHYITPSIREYSQWFPGEANVVPNSLSHNNDRMDSKLTNLFCTYCPSQTQEHFVIQPLPKEITLWLIALLLRLPVKPKVTGKTHRTKLDRGNDGQPIAAGLDYRTTYPNNFFMPCKNQSPWSICHGYAGSLLFKIISCQNRTT